MTVLGKSLNPQDHNQDVPDPEEVTEDSQIWAYGLACSVLPPNKVSFFLNGLNPCLVTGVYLWLLSEAMDSLEN